MNLFFNWNIWFSYPVDYLVLDNANVTSTQSGEKNWIIKVVVVLESIPVWIAIGWFHHLVSTRWKAGSFKLKIQNFCPVCVDGLVGT